jgi:acetylornithine/succinyldiaminopimelate/putrescine aminotransferase
MTGNEALRTLPQVVAAQGASLRDAGGRDYIDLCMGYGSVWLGHNHPAVTRALTSQLERYAAPGYLPTGTVETVEAAVRRFIPQTHFLGGIYSTGMEAMETALRAAWAHTGRLDVAGFNGSTYGRSFVTAAMGGTPAHGGPQFVHRLPPFSQSGLALLGQEMRELAARVDLAAIVVEPIQMTGGGGEISREACDTLFAIARERNVPVIFDEMLTGLHRCGSRFFFESTGHVPDVLVIGKGMGNGFPCAAVVLRKGFAWDRERVRPSSTFWNHPLACVAVASTLEEVARLDAARKVKEIEAVVRKTLGTLELRGRGAMWCLGVSTPAQLGPIASTLLEAGVVVSYYDRYVRLLPPLMIPLETLEAACNTIRKAHADSLR